MEPARADASDSASTDSESQRKGVRLSNASLDDDAPPPPPPPGPPPREEQPTTPCPSDAWNEVLGGGADGASPPAVPPAHPADDDDTGKAAAAWRDTAFGSHNFHSLYAYYPTRSPSSSCPAPDPT